MDGEARRLAQLDRIGGGVPLVEWRAGVSRSGSRPVSDGDAAAGASASATASIASDVANSWNVIVETTASSGSESGSVSTDAVTGTTFSGIPFARYSSCISGWTSTA